MKFIQIHQFYCTLPVFCDPSLWRLQTALCARLLNNSSGHWKTTVLGKLRSDLKKENPHTYSNLPSEGEAFPATPNTSKSIIFVLKFQEPVKSQSREGRVKCSSINIFPSRGKEQTSPCPTAAPDARMAPFQSELLVTQMNKEMNELADGDGLACLSAWMPRKD